MTRAQIAERPGIGARQESQRLHRRRCRRGTHIAPQSLIGLPNDGNTINEATSAPTKGEIKNAAMARTILRSNFLLDGRACLITMPCSITGVFCLITVPRLITCGRHLFVIFQQLLHAKPGPTNLRLAPLLAGNRRSLHYVRLSPQIGTSKCFAQQCDFGSYQ